MNAFLKELVQAHPKATYGEQMIRTALNKVVDTPDFRIVEEDILSVGVQLVYTGQSP